MSVVVRVLGPDDVPALESFLLEHRDSSLFLRSNLRTAGIVDRGEPYQGTYAAAFDGDRLVGVAAHCWNDSLVVQAPAAVAIVVREAVRVSGRRIRGIVGPWAQLVAARTALGLDGAATRMCSHDDLFALELAALVVPAPLAEGRVHCRATRADDLDLVTRWRVGYRTELMGGVDGPELRRLARDEIELLHRAGSSFLLENGGAPVAFSAFNARLPDVVQIGGVWTPPALRSRGYARAVVAGSLVAARAEGVTRSILFTGEDNPAAQRAYVALGYRRIGDYGLILF
ncbi:MAG TPA: GNAT family N-acetyltransferase [Candidatus Eisenbacteria bacterium]|nr:GNAT family N-acetyltransferase [Candidatus Eisenbacteria bacterium]